MNGICPDCKGTGTHETELGTMTCQQCHGLGKCPPEKYYKDADGNQQCQGCRVWYPPQYLASNEITDRYECKGCYLSWEKYEHYT